MRLSPERATFTQYFAANEQAAFERELTPQTQTQRERTHALAREGLRRLAAFDQRALDASQRVGTATLRYVRLLTLRLPLRRAADVSAYLARLAQVEPRLDESLARARAALARGLLPPRFVLERARPG